MKLQILIAISLSLSLSACAASPSAQLASATVPTQAAVPAKTGTESLYISLPLAHGFGTKLARYQDLAAVRFSVSGEGLSNSVTNSTAVTVDLDGDLSDEAASASLRNIPVEDGAWRVITAVGLDAEGNELPSFLAKAVYRSEKGTTSHNLSIDRIGLTLASAIEFLIGTGSDELEDIEPEDLPALQESLNEYLGYNPSNNHFSQNPLNFSSANVAAAIVDGSLLAGEAQLVGISNYSLEFNLVGDNGNTLTEDLLVIVNDPSSQYLQIPSMNPDGSYTIENVTHGTWTIEVRNDQGMVLDSAEVVIAENGSLAQEVELTVPGANTW